MFTGKLPGTGPVGTPRRLLPLVAAGDGGKLHLVLGSSWPLSSCWRAARTSPSTESTSTRSGAFS